MRKQKTALVLGGNGTIGTQLCKRLKHDGYWVRCVDRKANEFCESAADEVIIGDLLNYNFAKEVMYLEYRFDEVWNLCAEMGGAGFVFSKKWDSLIIYNSLMVNLNVAKSAVEVGCGRLFFSSSACAYGENLQIEINSPSLKESDAWVGGKPDSVYGIEKLTSEQIYDSFRRNNGLNIRIARLHNIFSTEAVFDGGREKFPAAICRKVAMASNGGYVEVWGDGFQVRSFLWIEECLDGMRRLMDSDYYEPLNIGSDESISMNDLAKMVIGFSGKDLSIKNVESNALGVRGRNSDNTLIEKTIGWKPTQKLEVGIKKLYDWINSEVNK